MPTKSEEYLDQYSAARRASRTYDAVVRDIRDERQQLQALQQLIASERNALVQLENAYDPDKTQDTIADEVLRATYSSEALAAQLAAQTKAAGAAATAVPKAIVDIVNQGEGGAAATNRAGLLAVSMLRNRDRPMTQQAADATLAYLEALGDRLPAGTLQRARQAAGTITDRPTRGPGGPALTPEQAAQEAGRQRALEAVYHSSPLGFAGAFEGEAEARKRRTTKAPGDTSYATADDALSTYLDMLEDGIASADELARVSGVDAEQAERDFRYAKGVYADAKAKGAYQNRQRKYFEPAWLSQAARVTRLERDLAAATPEVTRSVSEEAARRVLQQRGLDPDDQYLQFRGTPKYDYLRAADRIFDQVDEVAPATAAQKNVAALLEMYERTGTDWRLDDLAAELGKTLSGDELTEAVGFGMALDRQTREGRKPPDQRKLQAEERERVEAAERTRDALRAEAEAEIEAAKRERDALDAELNREVGRNLQQELRETPPKDRASEYARLRGLGASVEDARAAVLPLSEETLPSSGVDLRTPEQIAADLQRFEATGEATGEDFTLRGAVAPVEDEVDELTLRGEVVPVDETETTTADNGRELTDEELLEKYRRQ